MHHCFVYILDLFILNKNIRSFRHDKILPLMDLSHYLMSKLILAICSVTIICHFTTNNSTLLFVLQTLDKVRN